MSDDKRNKSDAQLFPETRDWSAVSEELALQLNADAQHLVKKYPAPSVRDLASQIAAKISSEQNSASRPLSLHVVNDVTNDEQIVDSLLADSSSEVSQDINPTGRIVIDRAESLEWLKIAAAALLFLTATASAIWYSSRVTENAASPTKIANERINIVPQNPMATLQSAPIIATTKMSNQEPVNAVSPIRGTASSEEIPIQQNSHIGEVSFDSKVQPAAPKHSIDNEAEMLRSQLKAFEQIIQSMQREIGDLRRETTKLQKELTDSKSSERKSKSRRIFGVKD